MLVSESHNALSALMRFLMGMWNDMSSKMRVPFEGFSTAWLFAYEGTVILMSLTDMSEQMCMF